MSPSKPPHTHIQNEQSEVDTTVVSEKDIDLALEDENGAPEAHIASIRKKLSRALSERQEYLEGWQRAKADIANMRRDTALMVAQAEERAVASLVASIASALDSFDMAMAGDAWQRVDDEWRRGVLHIQGQLHSALEAKGVSFFEPIGEEFDPHAHESVGSEHTDAVPADHVVRVIQKGIRVGDRIIRPARVIVAA